MGDMAIQDLQQNVFTGIDNTIVFCRVDQEGTVIEAQSAAETPPEKYFPRNHTEIVRRCLESAVSVRNVHSGSDYHTLLWDYFPVTHESCVHMYGTTLHTGMYDMKVFESIPDDHLLFQSLYRAPDAVIVYDNSHKILFANLKLTTLTGYHALELVGKPIETIIPVKYLKRHPLIHEFPEGEASQIRDRILLRKNGSNVEVESNEQVLPNNLYMMVLRDNRWRNRLQDDFQKAIRSEIYEKLFIKLRLFNHGEGMVMNLNRLALFLDNVESLEKRDISDRFIVATEEYRKIVYPELKSIGRYLQVLQTDKESSISGTLDVPEGDSLILFANKLKKALDNTPHRLSVIRKHRKEIQKIIKTIRKIVTETTFHIESHFICSLDDLIDMTVKKYRVQYSKIQIRLTDHLNGQVAIMNSSELGEVMQILMENAIESLNHYARDRADFQPCIHITLSVFRNRIRIEIRDNGPGIKKEHQTLLFKDGFSTKGPGHGFGLSYSARCVQKYGGRIYYESDTGYGACFVIELIRANTHDG
jgi:PAS domain S-box-containing protein